MSTSSSESQGELHPAADGPEADPAAAAAAADVNEMPRESTAIATMDIEAKMAVRTVWPRRAHRATYRLTGGGSPRNPR